MLALGDFATTAVERVHVYSAIPLRGEVVSRLLALKGLWRYTQGFSCSGQDIEALVPDVLCCVHVGVGLVVTVRAPED